MKSRDATTLEFAVSLLRKSQRGELVFIDAEDYCRRIAAKLLTTAAPTNPRGRK
jgi:hypothetical protein